MENKKKYTNIGIVTLILICIGVIISIFVINSTERKAERAYKEMGKKFYQDFYYELVTVGKTQEEINEFFDKRKEQGIKISIEDISKVNELDVKEQMNLLSSLSKDYDLGNSKVTIFPTGSYQKAEYRIEVNLAEKE